MWKGNWIKLREWATLQYSHFSATVFIHPIALPCFTSHTIYIIFSVQLWWFFIYFSHPWPVWDSESLEEATSVWKKWKQAPDLLERSPGKAMSRNGALFEHSICSHSLSYKIKLQQPGWERRMKEEVTDTQSVSSSAGCGLFSIQAKFPPFVAKLSGSALTLIITPAWNTQEGVGPVLAAL